MSDLRPGITACVAAHPARFRNNRLIHRALASICDQTLQPDEILVVNDKDKQGAGWTRRTILDRVGTEWLAWLDSDDIWFPKHLETLWRAQQETGAVYVFSYFQPTHGDPFTNEGKEPLGHFGKVFNPCNPHHTTITALVRTDLAKEINFPPSRMEHAVSDEDWSFIHRLAEKACQNGWPMVHVPERTWRWDQSGQNTSGLPHKGDAAR
jgi:glycosyltransferase involved in cell wall biosynthesis